MTAEEFIKNAIRGGWQSPAAWMENTIFKRFRGMGLNTENKIFLSFVLIDPKSWQAVGKVVGWDQSTDKYKLGHGEVENARWHHHRFIDALYAGRDLEAAINEATL